MKWIKYQIVCNEDENILTTKKLAYSSANLTIAQTESYNGSYTIEEDSTTFTTSDLIEDDEYSGCFYRMVGNEKEWLNPPMRYNVEYRTMESYCGSVVFTKLLNIDDDSKTFKMDGVYEIFSCTSVYQNMTDYVAKFSGADGGTFVATFDRNSDTLSISANGTATGVDEILVIIKYTKYVSRF